MAAKKKPVSPTPPKKKTASAADFRKKEEANKSKAKLNRVTSNIPSQVKGKKPFGQDIPLSRKGAAGVAEKTLYGATKIVGSTVLGGASAADKLFRKVTPLPDKPKSRAMRTEPTQYMRNGWGELVPVPKSKKKK